MVHIRPAEPRDYEALRTIFNEVIADGDTLVYEEPLAPGQIDRFADSNMTVHVAELPDGRIAGGYTLRMAQPGRGAHVCNAAYVVARDARGRRFGRTLGEHSLEQARQLGFTAMQFNAVVATNAPAVQLWRRLGFTVVGTLPDAFRRADGTFVDLLVMWRAL